MSDARPGVPILLLPALVAVLYAGGYAYARATHRLVRYGGGFIAGPNITRGIGFTAWELAFAPLSWCEEKARRAAE